MEKKYNISLILIALGICMFTSSFFVFSIDKVNDIYITQAKNDITHLKKSFLENTVNQSEQFGWIEVICGSMFSGKTEELIRRLKRAQFAKQKVEIFKPAIDVRYDVEKVVCTMPMKLEALPFLPQQTFDF